MNEGLGISLGGDARWCSVPLEMLTLMNQGERQPRSALTKLADL